MNRMTKGLTVLLFAGVVTNVSAGKYVGLNVGYNYASVSKDIYYQSTKKVTSDKYNGLRAQALIGYDFYLPTEKMVAYLDDLDQSENVGTFDPMRQAKKRKWRKQTVARDYFLAVEAAAAYNGSEAKAEVVNWFVNNDASTREKLSQTIDLFGLFKFKPAPNATMFIGPGFSVGKFEVYTPTETAGNIGVTGSFSQYLLGWSLKGGVKINWTRGYGLVLTYQYSKFNTASWNAVEPLTSENVTGRYSPAIHSITLGLEFPLGPEPHRFDDVGGFA